MQYRYIVTIESEEVMRAFSDVDIAYEVEWR